jgi:DNA repair protein RadC
MDELGPEALSDAELLALVIGGDPARADATARRLLAHGLSPLGHLRGAPGVRADKAAQLSAALELGRRAALQTARKKQRLLHAGDVAALLAPRLAHLDHEELWAVLLNARLEELRSVRVGAGGLTHCSILPREAFAPALVHAAPCVAFAHNHPSGDPRPSERDQQVSMLLDEVGRSLGLHVVDHLVITCRGHHSAREGFLSFEGEPVAAPPEPLDELFPITQQQEGTVCRKRS